MTTQVLEEKLEQLTQALKTANLWQDTPPSAEKLASEEPFCVDTLAFEEWLQWIFIPRLREMLSQPHFIGLPHRSDIATMAVYAFKDYQQPTGVISDIIAQIDELLNDFSPSIN